ncbi:MAG: HAD-IA family hydrolase [Synergistaceae bacterium]|jgi:HAD superfamily hydrolase (TIGR01549 family)|nr:HAD-IA family hydrolase [Synergistaceae bacterium]
MPFKPPFWSPSQAETIIFDWDGIIAETHLDFSALHEKYYGKKRAMLLEDSVYLAPSEKKSLMRDLEETEIQGASEATLVPGASDVIAWTEENKIPWAVVSRNCRKSILLAAERTSFKLPPIVRSRDDGDCVKPDPRALVETCRALGSDPARTLLIGDYIYDMMGARRAGMRGALVRKRIEPDWDQWLEFSCGSMTSLRSELDSPGETVAWEYRKLADTHGAGFLRKAAAITALVPADDSAGTDIWTAKAASLGIGAFAVPDISFSPRSWRTNTSFEPGCMGASLADAIRSFLRVRFPLVSVEPFSGRKSCIELPRDPDEIEDFLLSRVKRDG